MQLTYLLSVSSVLKSIGGILLAVVILLAMVTIHEFGHYLAGKALGFKITEFSVGFGPAIFKKRSKKTGELFALRVVPLGGYCAFDGEDEEGEEEKTKKGDFIQSPEPEQSPSAEESLPAPIERESEYPEPKGKMFNDQPPWKRIIVLVAGATMNYLLALLLIVIMFAGFGRPHSYLAAVENGSSETGTLLQADDVILEMNGKDLFLVTDYIGALKGKKAGDEVETVVFRKNVETGKREKLTFTLTLQKDAVFKNSAELGVLYEILGINSESVAISGAYMKEGFFSAIGDSFVYSFKIGGVVLRSLGELLTGKLSIRSMGGPVTTIRVASEAAVSGAYSFLNIAALIGVNLAVFNLLPIPALDGSKVVFCIIEWIRKKPINRKVEAMIHFIGIIFLFGFAILVDILQWF